jgi:DNA-binding transcriptional MocR family regulator
VSMAALKWVRDVEPGLSGVATAVLRDLADRANESGVCWPSIRTIVADTKFCERAVRNALRQLEQQHLLSVHQIAGRSSRYVLNVTVQPRHEMPDTPAPDAAPPARGAPKASISQREENRRARAPEEPRPNADAYRKANPDLPDVVVDPDVLELARQWLQ